MYIYVMLHVYIRHVTCIYTSLVIDSVIQFITNISCSTYVTLFSENWVVN